MPHFTNRIAIHGSPEHAQPHISVYRLVEVMAPMIKREMESDVYNLSHRKISSPDMVDVLNELYPDLETIFVDRQIRDTT